MGGVASVGDWVVAALLVLGIVFCLAMMALIVRKPASPRRAQTAPRTGSLDHNPVRSSTSVIDGGVPDWARAADPADRLGEPDPVATPTESTWDEDRQAWVFIDPIRGLFVHDTATDSWQRVPGVEPTGDPVTNSPAAVPAVFAAQPVAAAPGRSVEIASSHTAPEQAFAATVMQADPIEPSMNPHWDEQRNAWAFYAPDGQLLLHDAVANQWVPAEH